jgi:hypothetical protein
MNIIMNVFNNNHSYKFQNIFITLKENLLYFDYLFWGLTLSKTWKSLIYILVLFLILGGRLSVIHY